MIAVIFEVMPAPGREEQYLALAAALKQELGEIDGFISVERFKSLSDPGKMLSLSIFSDEAAVRQWRNSAAHRVTQRLGAAESSPTTAFASRTWRATTVCSCGTKRRRTAA